MLKHVEFQGPWVFCDIFQSSDSMGLAIDKALISLSPSRSKDRAMKKQKRGQKPRKPCMSNKF